MNERRQQSRMEQIVNGASKVVTLRPSPIGWEVRAWMFTIGAVRSAAEGDPYVHETFSDYNTAAAAYRLVAHAAVDHPGEAIIASGPMVNLADQETLDEASRVDRQSLDEVFAGLKERR